MQIDDGRDIRVSVSSHGHPLPPRRFRQADRHSHHPRFVPIFLRENARVIRCGVDYMT